MDRKNCNAHKGVKCFLANARSLKNKFQDLHAIVFAERFDILAVTETWFNPSVLDHEAIPSDYTIYRRDRLYRRGGGVLLAFKNDLTVVRRSDLETSCELLWCELTDDQGSKYLFGVFYRPSNTNMDCMELLGDSLSRISNSNAEKIFLVGDFNLPDFDWINHLPLSSDQLYVNSFEIFKDAFLTQVNPSATRNSNILDLVLTTVPDLVHSVSVKEGLLDSDHPSVTFFLNISNTSFHKRPKYVLNLKKANLKELKKTLQNLLWATAMLDNDVKI